MASFDSGLCWNRICSALNYGVEYNLKEQLTLAKINGWCDFWKQTQRMLYKALQSNPRLILIIFEFMPTQRVPFELIWLIKNRTIFDLEVIKRLFEDFNAHTYFQADNCEFLLHVIRHGKLEFMHFYTNSGLRLIEPFGKSAIRDAAWSQNPDMLKFTLGLGYSPYALSLSVHIQTITVRTPYTAAVYLNKQTLCASAKTEEIELLLRPYAFIPNLCSVLFLALFWYNPNIGSYTLRSHHPNKYNIRF